MIQRSTKYRCFGLHRIAAARGNYAVFLLHYDTEISNDLEPGNNLVASGNIPDLILCNLHSPTPFSLPNAVLVVAGWNGSD